jgi:hypothetical protein
MDYEVDGETIKRMERKTEEQNSKLLIMTLRKILPFTDNIQLKKNRYGGILAFI